MQGAYVGSAIDIRCKSKSAVTWYKEGKELAEHVVIDVNRIHIRNVQSDDSGVYKCLGMTRKKYDFLEFSTLLVGGL